MMNVKHDELPLLEVTDTADSETFAAFFRAYEEAFVLPDEMEDRDGFAVCLALNHGPAHQELVSRYGPFRELCCVARDPENRQMVGGANFIAVPHAVSGKGLVTANLNYLYVDRSVRGQGWLRPLVEAVRHGISRLFAGQSGEAQACLIFIEQNDPVLMADEAYARDSRMSGLDQFDRLRIWAKLGAKVVDFPYVQPPLSAEQAPDGNLIYSVLGADGTSLEAAILRRHLRSFFGISVLKGADLETEPNAAAQLAALAQMEKAEQAVPLRDPRPALDRLDARAQAALRSGARQPFREWLRTSA